MPPPVAGAPVLLFGYELKGKTLPFIITSGGIMLCYCLSSISQEYVYQSHFVYTSFLTLVCKLLAVGWGACGGGMRDRRAPHSWHAGIGALTFGTMWLSNESLKWLNYPTQTLFKSAKLLPVMAGALVINGKRFHPLEYVSAILLLMGLVAFTLTDQLVSPAFDPVGVLLICCALVADALIGNLQEKMFSTFQTTANEMMTYSSLWAAGLSLLACAVEGDTITLALAHLAANPWALLAVLLYALLNIVGIYFVLVMIALFGATLTTFTTSLRKGLSVVLSFMLYEKPFAVGYVIGGVATVAGVALNMRAAQIKRARAPAAYALVASQTTPDSPGGSGSLGETTALTKEPLEMREMDGPAPGAAAAAAGIGGRDRELSPGLPTTPFDSSSLRRNHSAPSMAPPQGALSSTLQGRLEQQPHDAILSALDDVELGGDAGAVSRSDSMDTRNDMQLGGSMHRSPSNTQLP